MRKLNEEGIEEFERFLRDARENPGGRTAPVEILWKERYSERVLDTLELEPLTNGTTAYQLVQHVSSVLVVDDHRLIEGATGMGDVGVWAGLALFYFDLLTPGFLSGRGKVKTENRYIPETRSEFAGVRYYRHLIAGPYRLYRTYGRLSEPLLCSGAHESSELYSKITDSAFYTQTRCLIEAISLLYFDHDAARLKPGYNAKNAPGTLPRLLSIVDLLDLTYDLLGIDGVSLVDLLPSEFRDWRGSVEKVLLEV